VGQTSRSRAPIKQRRAERELFFWTAFQILRLVVTAAVAAAVVAAMVLYILASLTAGQTSGGDLLLRLVGAG
jgi:hypothetical protein